MDNVLIFFLLRRKLDDTILIIIKRHTPELRMNPIFSFGRQGFPLKSVEGVVESYRPYTYVLSYVSSDSTNSTVVFQLFTGNGIKASHFLG